MEQELLDLKAKVNHLEILVNRFLENEAEIEIPYWLETEDAKLPERKKETDAGFDAYINEDKVIKAHSADKISLGVGFAIPIGYGIHARNRSGNFLGKNYPSPISIGDAWCDPGYRGIINALVQNVGDQDIEFKKGERVCSIDLVKTLKPIFIPVDEYCNKYGIDKENLMNTDRGATGFGATRSLTKIKLPRF